MKQKREVAVFPIRVFHCWSYCSSYSSRERLLFFFLAFLHANILSISLSRNTPEFAHSRNHRILSQMSADIGIFGLSPRAVNLAVNLATKEQTVVVGHRSSDLVAESKFASRVVEGVRASRRKEGGGREDHNHKGCTISSIIISFLVRGILRILELTEEGYPHGETRLECGKELLQNRSLPLRSHITHSSSHRAATFSWMPATRATKRARVAPRRWRRRAFTT